jgi:hypothetical protein
MKLVFAISMSLAAFDASAYFPSDAALSYLLQSLHGRKEATFCISIDNKKAGDAFVLLAKGKNITLSPSNDCHYNKDNHSIIHQPSGESACFVSISGFKKLSPTTAVASTSGYCGPLASGSGKVVFVLRNKRWVFKEYKFEVIS